MVTQAPPAPYNDSLLQFGQDNVTFQNIQLINIGAGDVDHVLLINGTNNILQGLVSRGCNVSGAVVAIEDASGPNNNSTTLITGASFSNVPGPALYLGGSTTIIKSSSFKDSWQGVQVDDSNTTVIDTVFANNNMTYGNSSGAAMTVSNKDGSPLQLTNCSFLNNSVPDSQ